MSNPEELVSKLTDSIGSVLHKLVDLAPWREEAARNEAHSAVTDHVEALADVAQHIIPAGVVEQPETPHNPNPATADSFPSNPQE